MFKRLFLFVALLGLLLCVGAVFAKEDSTEPVPTNGYIYDGRLNGADVAAPVAIFYRYETVRLPGDWTAPFKEVDKLEGIELLAIDPVTNNGRLVMDVPVTTIIDKIDTGHHKDGLLIASNEGFSLYYSDDNWFYVTAPADKEGKTYTYQWQNFTFLHD